MGASGSLLTAAMTLEVCMPARCWIAPEIPAARYSCGETVLPVWPTWLLCGYQPASTAARDAPTAAPSRSASLSIRAKCSAPPRPRPPDTTIEASVSSGRPELSRTSRAVIVAAVAACDSSTATSRVAGWACSGAGVVAFGFTAMTGTPEVTAEVTVNDAAKADWVATTACPESGSPAPTSTASRSEEHTSELQSRRDLVCRLLLEKKKKKHT